MKRLFVLAFVFLSLTGFSQSSLHRRADRYFNKFEFVKAAHLYEKIVRKNPNDENALIKLGQCYNALNVETMKVHELIQRKIESGVTPKSNQDLREAKRR